MITREEAAIILRKIQSGMPYQTTDEFLASVDDVLREYEDMALIQSATVILTDEQIKSLPTTPVEIIPAPGLNKRIQFMNAWCQADFGAGAYSNASGATLCFRIAATNPAVSNNYYEDIEAGLGSDDQGQIWHFGMFNTIHAEHGFLSEWMAVAEQVDNQPLMLTAEHIVDDIPVNFIGGNSDNELKVTVFYSVIDL